APGNHRADSRRIGGSATPSRVERDQRSTDEGQEAHLAVGGQCPLPESNASRRPLVSPSILEHILNKLLDHAAPLDLYAEEYARIEQRLAQIDSRVGAAKLD